MDKTIVRTLAKFNINSSRWDYNEQFDDAVAVTGHTATLVGNKMIVIFGLSTDGPFPKVQEYDIGMRFKVKQKTELFFFLDSFVFFFL